MIKIKSSHECQLNDYNDTIDHASDTAPPLLLGPVKNDFFNSSTSWTGVELLKAINAQVSSTHSTFYNECSYSPPTPVMQSTLWCLADVSTTMDTQPMAQCSHPWAKCIVIDMNCSLFHPRNTLCRCYTHTL